jgi:hypothetical protein
MLQTKSAHVGMGVEVPIEEKRNYLNSVQTETMFNNGNPNERQSTSSMRITKGVENLQSALDRIPEVAETIDLDNDDKEKDMQITEFMEMEDVMPDKRDLLQDKN